MMTRQFSFMIERYLNETSRFNTFLVEPVFVSSEKAEELARNGFINWSNGTCAEFLCVFCSTLLKKIKINSDIVKLHKKKSPNCSIYSGSKYFKNHPRDSCLFNADAIRYQSIEKHAEKRKTEKINGTTSSLKPKKS